MDEECGTIRMALHQRREAAAHAHCGFAAQIRERGGRGAGALATSGRGRLGAIERHHQDRLHYAAFGRTRRVRRARRICS